MNRSSITAGIEQIHQFLESTGQYLLSGGDLEDYRLRTGELLEKAYAPGEVLYAGILGGTGVGKSTLVNALAGERISDPSDRRPYTDKAVVYRYRETPRGLEKVSNLLREPDAVHGVDAIRDLILLDLPDFDSVEENNRRTVLHLLPEMDSIVWVVSPEKYADAVFYDMVRRTRMHRDSFTFVLNKADDLMMDGCPDPHGRIKEVQGDLIFRLRHDARMEEPRVFTISAEKEFVGEVYDTALADEFRSFSNFLMARRDAKEIASVKTANLIEEARRLLEDLDAKIHPEEKARILKTIARIESEPIDPEKHGIEGYEYEKALGKAILRHLSGEDGSIAPVRWAMRLLSPRRLSRAGSSDNVMDAVFQDAAKARMREVSARLEKTGALMDSELLLAFRQGSETQSQPRADELLNASVKDASRAFVQNLAGRVQSLRGPFARLRRFGQKTALGVPVLLLILRLCGLERLEACLDSPSLACTLKLFFALFTTLFSSEGLTGLLVMAICQVIIVYFLAAGRIRKLEKDSRNLADSAMTHLNARLDSVAAKIEAQRKRSIAHMQEGIAALTALNAEFLSADRLPNRGSDVPSTEPWTS
ncbi:MAG: GTPase [Pseudomonadota bacterium]